METIEKGLQKQQEGQFAAAEKIYFNILDVDPNHPECTHYLGLLRFEHKQFETAFELLEKALALAPRNKYFVDNLAVARRKHDEQLLIVKHMRQEVSDNPEDYVRKNTLAAAYLDAGMPEDAVNVGQESLHLQDEYFSALGSNACGIWAAEKPSFDPNKPQRNIIAFSLWGTEQYYIDGAFANVKLASTIYRGWRCRFYVDDSISPKVIRTLEELGAEIIRMPNNENGKFGLFWRFFVASDPEVDFFLCRDCDSRLNLKEHAAVEEWLRYGGLFHVMRDNLKHLMLMPAGLWGGVGGLIKGMDSLAREYYQENFRRNSRLSEWIDQEFLAEKIWPLIATRTLTHDAHYKVRSTRVFPSDGGLIPPEHVGGAVPRWNENSQTERRPFRV